MNVSRPERRYERVPFAEPVSLWRLREQKVLAVRDLSVGGLSLQRDDDVQLEAGTFATVTIALPGEARFSALCRVVRTQPGDVALEFVDVGPGPRSRVEAYVRGAHPVPAARAA